MSSSFQSTPVIADGRIGDRRLRNAVRSRRFNPRPSLLTGESEFGLLSTPTSDVSIHARHC